MDKLRKALISSATRADKSATGRPVWVKTRFSDLKGGRDLDILIGAYHCIAELGIAATTTRAVAHRAGLNQGAIHYYFASKEELIIGVLRGVLNNSIDNVKKIRDSNFSSSEKLEFLLRTTEQFIVDREEVIVRVALWAHIVTQGGPAQDLYRRLFSEFRDVLADIIIEGVADEAFDETHGRAAAEIVITAIFGLGMQFTMDASNIHREDLRERIADFYSRVLSSPSDKLSAADLKPQDPHRSTANTGQSSATRSTRKARRPSVERGPVQSSLRSRTLK